MSVEQTIRDEYPQVAWLLDVDPEVRDLLLNAFDPTLGFDALGFESKLYATDWFRTNSESMRQWQTLKGTDPAEAEQQISAMTGMVDDLVRNMFGNESTTRPGVSRSIAEKALLMGWDENQIRDYVVITYQSSFTRDAPGAAGQTIRQVRDLGNQYLIDVSGRQANEYAMRLAAGSITEEGIRGELAARAEKMFPHLAAQIANGMTPAEYFADHKRAIAETLELPGGPDSVDLVRDSRFRNVIQHHDKDSVRAMTVPEATRFARGMDEWQNTKQARDQAATFASELGKMFGRTV